MANTPKHKLLFGIPYGFDKPSGVGDGSGDGPTIEPCWTWDSGKSVFSSGSLGFDCGFDVEYELSKELEKSGFTWDNDVITLDAESQIF
jgi:hypothetical protein